MLLLLGSRQRDPKLRVVLPGVEIAEVGDQVDMDARVIQVERGPISPVMSGDTPTDGGRPPPRGSGGP